MFTAETSPVTNGLSVGDNLALLSSSAQLNPELKDQLKKELGLNDEQLNAWLALANPDDLTGSASSDQFSAANRETLNTLDDTDELSPLAQSLLNTRAPVAMAAEVSNPANWQQDQYIGPGAVTVNSFFQSETVGLPVDDLDPPIDPSTISIDALVMSVLTQRAEIIEVQLREQIASIQEKNAELEEANQWLVKAKDGKAKTDDELGTRGSFTVEMQNYWNSLGAEYYKQVEGATAEGALIYKEPHWDVAIEGLKAKIEALTSQSQLETTKLQQTINKYNQSFEMLSNFINKYYQSINTIIQNLR